MKTKKKAAKKNTKTGKNKPGVKNSLVNNINARNKKGVSRSKKKSTIDGKPIIRWKKKEQVMHLKIKMPLRLKRHFSYSIVS